MARRRATAIHPGRVRTLAKRTLSCPTAPYREGEVISWLREFAASHDGLALREDPDGNLEIRRRGVRASRRPLVLSAHMDHPGFRATRCKKVRDGWRLDAVFLGGVASAYFDGARARFFHGEEETVARVVSTRLVGPHRERHVRLHSRRRVPRGAFGMWDLPAFRLSRNDPDLIQARAADDLAGVAAILALMDRVDRVDPRRRVDVRGLFTRAEEVGFVGALAVAQAGRLPRGAQLVAIETSRALEDAPQGGGPIVRVGDRTSVFDDALTRWLVRVGSALASGPGRRFRWQRALMDGGTCESTAYQLFGYRCTAMCLALGNYHNMGRKGRIAAETIRLSDLVGLVRFFEGLVQHHDDAPRGRHVDPLRFRLEKTLARNRKNLARTPWG